ncbi:amidohydrolase [Dactylosporangium vinaceum]|uniref:M20 aminoacylase family protein n=1 Tax=Dactylosporangium vinaceum TaxID=53362 RepID=A0ABV5M5S7_9ACTN|nr:M20 aminoacylase family protein [Dactylosporangium vinaceum]UAC01269.1 amidohydrolase [Dactylosporangium vinaceum]
MQTGRLRAWRHDLHRIPELGLREHRTADYLAGVLTALGLHVTRGVGGTGLVATLRRGDGGAAVGLRADMDGLPLAERGERAYRSVHDGVMHACGHDGHMAMVLGAAAVLADEGGFDGTVQMIFQPAEEHGLGAKAMLADGLLERFPVDAIFGVHNMPGHPAGWLATRAGGLMAGEDNFEIRVLGRGGHAARPQMVVDPIVIAAEIVLALQTVVSRSVDPAEPAVVSCTEITTDGARNAIPGEVVIRGDTRSFAPDVRVLLERRIRELAAGISAAHGGSCAVRYTHEFEPTVNDPGAVAAALHAARRTVPAEHVVGNTPQWTASEDFGAFLQAVPGCFMLLGNGAGSAPLHSPDYDFNDDVLEIGVRYYVNLVRSRQR